MIKQPENYLKLYKLMPKAVGGPLFLFVNVCYFDKERVVQAYMDRFAEDGSLDDNVESFLSHEEADQREPIFSCSKRSPGHSMDVSKGLFLT